jgi:hypothetical protein
MSQRFRIQDASGVIIDDEPIGKAMIYTRTGLPPANAQAGFDTGCICLVLGSAALAGVIFVNQGTNLSSLWVQVDPSSAASRETTVTAALSAAALKLLTGKTINLNNAAGFAVTLPAATGSGNFYRFFIGTTVTSVGMTIVATGAYLYGNIVQAGASGAATAWTAAPSTTITLNGSTKGGLAGDFIDLEDVATNQWSVRGLTSITGTAASPFS